MWEHSRMKSRDSLGGITLTLAVGSIFVGDLLSRIIDGAELSRNQYGQRIVESDGHMGRLIGLVILAGALLVALFAIVEAVSKPVHRTYSIRPEALFAGLMVLVVTWWVLMGIGFRGEVHGDILVAVEMVAMLVVMVAVCLSPPTLVTVHRLAVLLAIIAVALILYSMANGDQMVECRPDKCGAFGSMWTGFLYQENGAARYIVLFAPATAMLRRPSAFYGTNALIALFVLGTGSRTSAVTLAVAVVLAWLIRRSYLRGWSTMYVPVLVRLIPLAALGVAAWMFFTAHSNVELSGRGEIFEKIRELQTGFAILVGSGSDTVANLKLNYGALAFGEHGEVPHLLTRTGYVGLLLFAAALACLVLVSTWTIERAVGLALLIAASSQFMTEPALELQPRTMSYLVLALIVGLIVRPAPVAERKPPTPIRTEVPA